MKPPIIELLRAKTHLTITPMKNWYADLSHEALSMRLHKWRWMTMTSCKTMYNTSSQTLSRIYHSDCPPPIWWKSMGKLASLMSPSFMAKTWPTKIKKNKPFHRRADWGVPRLFRIIIRKTEKRAKKKKSPSSSKSSKSAVSTRWKRGCNKGHSHDNRVNQYNREPRAKKTLKPVNTHFTEALEYKKLVLLKKSQECDGHISGNMAK